MIRACVITAALLLLAGCGGDDQTAEQQFEDPTDVISTKGRVAPNFLFPKDVACDNPEVNEFITGFSTVCLKGEYLRYRLRVSRQVEPISRESFQAAWQSVEQVRITKITQLADQTGYPPPVYLVNATVKLREPATPPSREVAILVFKEGQQWVMAPASRQLRDNQTESQPVEPTDQ
jgi:hypothetical protein